MKLETCPAGESHPALGALLGGVFLIGAALSAVWIRIGLPFPICLFRKWTGLPCPTCGSTRMVESVLSGELIEAVTWNPLVFLVLSTVAVWAVFSSIRWAFALPMWRVVPTSRERLALRLLAAAALIAGWAYLVWRGV